MPRDLEGRTCASCGSAIVRVPNRGPLPTFCSPRCRWAKGHKCDTDRRAKLRAGLSCEVCGVSLGEAKRLNRFCSMACSQRKRRKGVTNAVS